MTAKPITKLTTKQVQERTEAAFGARARLACRGGDSTPWAQINMDVEVCGGRLVGYDPMSNQTIYEVPVAFIGAVEMGMFLLGVKSVTHLDKEGKVQWQS